VRRLLLLVACASCGLGVSSAQGGIRPGVLPERITPPFVPSSTRLHFARDHSIPARIGCPPIPGSSDCHGTAIVQADRDIGAQALTRPVTFSSVPGRRIVVRLILNARGRKLIGHNGLKVRLLLTDFGLGTAQTARPMLLSLR
jgi:hypothetical protein